MGIIKPLVAAAAAFGSVVLPSGLKADTASQYRMVEWIESTGTQYFDTEFCPDGENAKFELKFQVTQRSTGENWAMATYGGGLDWRVGVNGSDALTGSGYVGARLKNFAVVRSKSAGTSPRSCYLFAQHDSRTSHLGCHVRLWFCRFWNNAGELASDLVPAIRMSDGKAGLYDRAKCAFLESEGTGDMLFGAVRKDVVLVPVAASGATVELGAPADFTDEDGNLRQAASWTFRDANGAVVAAGSGKTARFAASRPGTLVWAMYADGENVGFADEYHAVEYIESDGAQYIDTGYVPNGDTSCEVVCKQVTSKGENIALGIWTALHWRARTDQDGNGFKRTSIGDDWYLVKSTSGLEGANVSVMLYAQNGGGYPSSLGTNLRIASCTFKEGDVTVMDLRPVIRWADRAAGFYDRVSGRFLFDENCDSTPLKAGFETGEVFHDVQNLGVGQQFALARPVPDLSADGRQRWLATNSVFATAGGTVTNEGASVDLTFAEPGRLTWNRTLDAVKIEVTSGEHGTVTPAEQWCAPGAVATFRFAADRLYGFAGFTGDAQIDARSFTVEGPLRLTASFTPGEIEDFLGLDYVDSNRSQYFDTGFTPSGNGSYVRLEHQFLSTTSGENWLMSTWGGESWRTGVDSGLTKFVSVGNFMSYRMGDHSVREGTGFNGRATYSCYLCAQHADNGASYTGDNIRLYSGRIGDNGGLYRDYVAACRAADGTPGVYDRVHGEFDPGLGNGTLLSGPTNTVRLTRISGFEVGAALEIAAPADCTDEKGVTWTANGWRLLAGDAVVDEGLGKTATIAYPGPCTVEWAMFAAEDLCPYVTRYQALEYLQSSGAQGINTHYIPKPATSCEVKAYQVESGGENIAVGVWVSPAYWRGRTDQNGNGFTRTAAGDGWYLLKASEGPASAATVPAMLFGQNINNACSTGVKMRIAYARFWEDGEPVVDLVPVRRESDGELGFYDLACGAFRTSVMATPTSDSFVAAGPALTWAWDDVANAVPGMVLTIPGPEPGALEDGSARWSVVGWTFVDSNGGAVSGEGDRAVLHYQRPGRLTWKYRIEHPMALADGVHCTVTPPAGWDGWGAEDEPVTFTVTPDAGYEFYKLEDGETVSFAPSIAPQRPFTALTAYCAKRIPVAVTGSSDDRTLQAAIDAAGVGDIIEVSGANCELDATLNVTNEVRLVASPSTLFYKKKDVQTVAIKINQKNAVVSGVTLTNRYDQASYSTRGVGVYVVNGTLKDSRIIGLKSSHYYLALENGLIRNCEICNCTGSYYNDPPGSVLVAGGICDGLKVHHNTGDYSPGVAITGGELRNAAIYANTQKKEQQYRNCAGIYAKGGKVWNCTVYGNVVKGENLKPSGLAVDGTVTVRNCIFWRNYAEGATGGSVSIGAGKDFSHNVNDIELANYPDTITDDPCLMNPDGGNFRLLHGSPCVDAGENAAWMEGATDLRGRARVLNKTVDIGCRESIPDGLMLILR